MKIFITIASIILIAGYFLSCDDADYHEGVNYTYERGVLEYLFTYNNGKFGNHYYFYRNGMIRSIEDTTGKYWIYDSQGNLTTLMYYKLLPNKSHYCKYYTLDSSCQLEYNDGLRVLKINDRIVKFKDTSLRTIYPTDYSLVLKKDSLEIHGFRDLDDIKIAIFPIN